MAGKWMELLKEIAPRVVRVAMLFNPVSAAAFAEYWLTPFKAAAHTHRAEITSLAARYRLPAVYPFRLFAEAGGLLSYGLDRSDNFRRAATYVDRILKGEKPSELPVEAPVKFDLVINLKAAIALGLEVPAQLLGRADEVIE